VEKNTTGLEIAKKYDWETKAGQLENFFKRYMEKKA
jgi:hypothetical protein